MVHNTLVLQPLEKSDKKHGYDTISKKFGTIPVSTKSSPTTSNVSPTSTPDRLTTQDIINTWLRKSTCQKSTKSQLSQKLQILLLLLGGQRRNSVLHFTFDRMIMFSTSVTFSSEHVLKHSKTSCKLDASKYWAYSDPKLCVLECVKEYTYWRNDRVDKEQKRLFTTYRKLYHTGSIDTIRRWIKETFAKTNLIENFTLYSCRSASTTKVSIISLDILDILRKDFWTNAKTFIKHYKRETVIYEGVDSNKIMKYWIFNVSVIFMCIEF